MMDPRPDLLGTLDWNTLLFLTYDDRDDFYGLYGALDALRCLGAKYENGRLEAGEIHPSDWSMYRKQYLMPHREKLTTILGQMGH